LDLCARFVTTLSTLLLTVAFIDGIDYRCKERESP